MARGGRVIYKKSNGGRKRKTRSKDGDDDDEDEEYVVEEDEEEESGSNYGSDVNSRDLSDEESFDFSGSDSLDDDGDEEKDLKIARSKKNQRNRKNSKVSDDEMEDLSVPKKRGKGRSRKQEPRDSDYELDDEDDDDEDFSPDEEDFDEVEDSKVSKRKRGVKKPRSKLSKAKGRKKRTAVSLPVRKRQKTMIQSSDDDFIVKDRVSVRRKRMKSKKVRKKGSLVDSESLDSDFMRSDDDFIGKDLLAINNCRKNSSKGKKTWGSNGRRKKRSTDDSYPSDSDVVRSDDDFLEKDLVAINNCRKNSKKVKKTAGSKGRRKKRSTDDSNSSDSDFVISDDDDFDVEDQFVGDKQHKKSKKEKVVRFNKKKRRKRSSVVLESSDSDYLISEDDDEFVLKDQVVVKERKRSKKARKRKIEPKITRKRSADDSDSSDSDFVLSDDDDFDVEDQFVVDKQQKKSKKKKVAGVNKRRRRKRSSVVLESSDSDYLIYEDDDEFVLKDQVVDEERKRRKKTRKRRTEPKITRKRSSLLVDSESESLNCDNVISKEEVRDLGIGGGLNQEQPKRVFALMKGEEKGKEKQDPWKQVCGVCLSEENKSVVQGLLNCCSHYFCFACIMEWSKVESRCPLCKRRFETITKSGKSDPGFFGMRSAVIRVQKRDQVYQPSEEELRGMLDPYENVVCMECQQGGDDNLMLLCDICDSSAHTYCVGLGREVPEGNWYCECCRSVSEGSSRSQFQDSLPDPEASNSNLFPGVTEIGAFTSVCASTNSPQPVSMYGRSSSLRIDLNALPRDFPGEDHFVSSPISGSGASTVSGRRHIRQRIHVILSSNRQRQTSARTNMVHSNSVADFVTTGNGVALPVSDNLSPLPSALGFEQWHQSPRPFFRSRTNLAPCMFNEGSSLRHVDGAKEEVRQMVKNHLNNLYQNRILDRSTFKEIAKNSTHTILAACGIEHHRRMVSAAVEPPDNCTHDSDDGPTHLLKGCCSSCFSSFVKDVVQRLINTS